MKKLIFIFSWMLLFSIATAMASPVKLDRDYTINQDQNAFSIVIEPFVNEYLNGEYVPRNINITDSTDLTFDYMGNTSIYTAYFKEDPTEGQAIKYIKNNTEITFQPMALNYRNDLNQLQQIQQINSVTGVPSVNKFIYPQAYGTDTTLQYIYKPSKLVKELVLDSSLPQPAQYIIDGGNPVLELNFILGTNAQHIEIDGIEWDKKTDELTYDDVYIKDDSGNVLYYLEKPYAKDNSGAKVDGGYFFKKTGNTLFVSVHIPYNWLNDISRSYPITIDPTVAVQINDTVEINLTDDEFDPLRTIIVYNFTDNGNNTIFYDNLNHNHSGWVESYAIDPTNLDFTDAVVITKKATGNKLFKCVDWNFTTEVCYGDWVEQNNTLILGQEYNFTLTPTDPAYAEQQLGTLDGVAILFCGANCYVRAFNSTGGVQWTGQLGTGDLTAKDLKLLDTNEDGLKSDIVVGRRESVVLNVSADTVWSYDTGFNVQGLAPFDYNNDGNSEAVALCDANKDLTAIDSDGSFLWTYDVGGKCLPKVGVSYADFDADGNMDDLIVAVDAKSNQVFGINGDGTVEWTDAGGDKFQAVWYADFDEDGYYDDTLAGNKNDDIVAYDETGTELWNYDTGDDIFKVVSFDYKGIGFLSGTAIASKNNKFLALNSTGGLLWEYTALGGLDANAISVVDYDSDGKMNHIIGGANDNKVYVFNSTGSVMWSYTTGGFINDVMYADFDSDGYLDDVIAGSEDGYVYAFEHNGTLLWSLDNGDPVDVVTPLDTDEMYFEIGAPDSITNLAVESYGTHWIKWNWTNPTNLDFNVAIIYINGTNVLNTTNEYYTATDLMDETTYTITIHTADIYGEVNDTDVSSSQATTYNVAPSIGYVSPTPDDYAIQLEQYVEINISINDTYLTDFVWNWNGTNYTVMNDSVILLPYLNESADGIWYFYINQTVSSNDIYTYQAYVEDFGGKTNQTEQRQINIGLIGTLDATLLTPEPNTTTYVLQNDFFTIEATATCTGTGFETCGNVYATARFNGTPYYDDVAGYWWNESWDKRKQVIITNVVGTSLSNFPVYLNVTNAVEMQSDYNDLRFISGNCSVSGGTELDYEIENYTTTNAHIWLRMPTLSTGNNQICMYYNNSIASSGQNVASVWDGNYEMVQHLQESDIDGGSGDIKDSTSNSFDGTTVGMSTTDQVSGQIDGSFNIAGGDYVDMGNVMGHGKNEPVTYSAWMKSTSSAGGTMASKADSPSDQGEWFYMTSAGRLSYYIYANGFIFVNEKSRVGTATINDGQWHYVVATYDGSNNANGITLYVDGELDTISATVNDGFLFDTTSGVSFNIGSIDDGAGYDYTGLIDELRVSDIARTGSWINQSYQLMANQDSFVSFSTEENLTYQYNMNITNISTVSGTLPFYTNSSQPQSCNLNASDSCNFVWYVNATGIVLSEHLIDVYLTSSAPIDSFNTENATVKIVDSVGIYNLSLNPELFLSNFNTFYNYTVMNDSAISYVNLSYQIYNPESTCGEFYVNGTCADDKPTKVQMSYSGNNIWSYSPIYPDELYPQIEFAEDEVFWYNGGLNRTLYKANYHIMKFINNYTIIKNTSFWIEFDADALSTLPLSKNLQVYVFNSSTVLTDFQQDWRTLPFAEQVAIISSFEAKDHIHTVNSSHYLVQLKTNTDGTIGTKHLNISGQFWIVLYNADTSQNRGWALDYRNTTYCTTNQWWRGNGNTWTTTQIALGCPNVHVHFARYNLSGSSDGANATACTTDIYGQNTCVSTIDYFGKTPNLKPQARSIITPPINGIVSDTYNITWLSFLDPNFDKILYNLTLVDTNGNFVLSLVNLTNLTYYDSFDSIIVPNGFYGLNLTGQDPEGLWDLSRRINFTIYNMPDSVTNLNETDVGYTWILWNWTNPIDHNFDYSIIYINGTNVANTSNEFYNATGILNNTYYEITINTVDVGGNINTTNVTDLAIYYTCTWVQDPIVCLMNDTYIISYTETTSCGYLFDLPVDNGTAMPCNYCTEDIIANYSDCIFNGTVFAWNYNYTDNNYLSCCGITGLVSDCSILYSPYNETESEICRDIEDVFEVNIDDEIYYDYGYDKVYAMVHINGTEYANMNWSCMSYAKTTADDVVQVNPQYVSAEEGTVFSREIEDRQSFQVQNNLANVHWTNDNIVIDGRPYIFGVDCSSDTGLKLTSEVPVTVHYASVNAPITRLVWIQENVTGIIMGLLIFLIVITVLGLLISQMRN